MNTERRKFIWQTVWTVALAIAVTVAPSLFPNMPWWLSWSLFGGGVLATIIAFARLYFLQGKKDVPASDVNTPVSVAIESKENKPIPTRQIVTVLAVTWIVAGVAVFYGNWREPEYTKGLSRQEIDNVKEELSHLKRRTMVLECADTEADRASGLGCIPLINTFHYMFLDWPHTMDDPEAGIVLPFKHAEGVKGLQLSPYDETTRAMKKAIEGNTKLTVKLIGRLYRGNTSQTIFLIVGSPP